MTIRKGAEWGSRGAVPAGTRMARDNAALFALLNAESLPVCVGLLGGDLARTVSATGGDHALEPGSEAIIATIDLGVASHDHGTHRFAAHALARRSWWRGQLLLAANAQFVGHWDVAPRSHPNDGYLDITEVSPAMTLQQRLAARRRLPTATHVPHPAIRTMRLRTGTWTFSRPLDLWLDGVRVGRTERLAVEVIPDALSICF